MPLCLMNSATYTVPSECPFCPVPLPGPARGPTVAWVSGSPLLIVPVLEDMSALLLTRVFSMCMTVCSHGRRSGATGMRPVLRR